MNCCENKQIDQCNYDKNSYPTFDETKEEVEKKLFEKDTNYINTYTNIYEFLTDPTSFKSNKNFIGSGLYGSVIKTNKIDKIDKIDWGLLVCKIIKIQYNDINPIIKEITYQKMAAERNIAPKIMDFFFYKYNENAYYGIIIMKYLENYTTIKAFIEEFKKKEDKHKHKFYENYKETLCTTLNKFINLNLFSSDFQFMINNDGTDIQIIDFGEFSEFKANEVLKDGEEEWGTEDLIFENILQYRDYLYKQYTKKINEYYNPAKQSHHLMHRPSTAYAKRFKPYGGRGITQKKKRKKKKKKLTKKYKQKTKQKKKKR
jgi:hypothetical protein